MRNRNLMAALIAVGLIGAAGFGAYRIGMNQGMKMAASPAAGGTEAAGKKVLYWHDPMVPGQKFDKPGKSPFMDMQLVPVYADGGDDQGAVNISSRVQQNLGVRTVEVTLGNLASAVSSLRPDQTGVSHECVIASG